MVKSCINCGCEDLSYCIDCETTAKPDAAPTNWVPKNVAPDICVGRNQEAKADGGKLRISLVPTQIVRDIAEVREYGACKYGDPDNWKKVELDRYVDALMRHTLEFLDEYRSVDQESGIPHYKHMACNMDFICEILGGRV